MCNITLKRRRGSRPDGARLTGKVSAIHTFTGYGADCTVNCQPGVNYVDTVKFDNNISNITSASYNISFPC